MNDAVNVRVFLENLIETSLVGDINVVELWPLAADEFNAIEDLLGSIVKIVGDDHFVVCIKEGQRGERTNVTAPTRAESMYGVRLNGVFVYAPRDEN